MNELFNELTESDKKRLLEFIQENDLDLTPIDDDINRFRLVAYDKKQFFIYPYNESYIILKYDKDKDIEGPMGSKAWEYFQYQNLQQVLEQLSNYDKSIPKSYWYPTTNSIEIGFDSNSYADDWLEEFKGEDEFWGVEDSDNYKYLTYNNNNYKPKIKSPFNTLHEVSPINDLELEELATLNFEIHPISCADGQESYHFKLCCNNEEVLKEYINYIVSNKKGLRMFLETLFREMEQFKKP